jgi:hypothetical protein
MSVRPVGATVGSVTLGLAGAFTAGAGIAGIVLTSTVDFAAFGPFAAFVNLAVPYAYGAAAILATIGIVTMIVANNLYAGRSYVAGLVLSGLLALTGVAAILFGGRLPISGLGDIASGLGGLCFLPLVMLLLGAPYYRR